MNIRPLGNNIIFTFIEETTGKKGAFVERPLKSGILLPQSANRQKIARWGKVVAVGPKVEGISPGEFVLIEALMWTFGADTGEGEKVWKTDDTKVLLVTSDESACQPQAI